MPGKIKMNIMMKPVLGKEFFELMSLAVSAVNGCEMCVNAHENSLKQLESTEETALQPILNLSKIEVVYQNLDSININNYSNVLQLPSDKNHVSFSYNSVKNP